MLEFASGTLITIEVPYEYNGESLTLTNFEYELLDATGTVIIDKQVDPDFDANNSFSTLSLPAADNTTTLKRDVRQLNCYLTNAAGTYIVSQVYMLKGNALTLTPPTDSFMTFPQSILIRAKIAEEQIYYDALTDELKVIALENSFTRISRLKFQIGDTVITDITSYTLSDFNALDAKFLEAIRKAQIIEANVIVEQSPIRDKIRQGIISETIGESSMFFKTSGPVGSRLNGLSDDAQEILSRYLYRDVSNAQIWKLNRA
jgi:hypothetical protein